MLAIVGAGAVVNRLWAAGALAGANATLALNPQPAATQSLTRIQNLTGDQTGQILDLVILVTFAAAVVFVVRHSQRLHRLLTKGEAFVSDHPLLDIVTVFVFTAGFVLTRVVPS